MKYIVLATVLTALAPIVTCQAGGQAEGEKRRAAELIDIRTLLRQGRDAGSLPPGMVVRVDAHVWKADRKDRNLKETWEFTANQLHRVVLEKDGAETVYRRAESIPFDSKNICKALLDGGIHAIATQEGMGEVRQFVGTDFDLGYRRIDILVDEKSALQVGESCAFAGYSESNARAFAKLYEQLASQARAAFEDRE